jgi:hypothetical protein
LGDSELDGLPEEDQFSFTQNLMALALPVASPEWFMQQSSTTALVVINLFVTTYTVLLLPTSALCAKKIDGKFGILVQNMVQNMPIHLRY